MFIKLYATQQLLKLDDLLRESGEMWLIVAFMYYI